MCFTRVELWNRAFLVPFLKFAGQNGATFSNRRKIAQQTDANGRSTRNSMNSYIVYIVFVNFPHLNSFAKSKLILSS